MNTGLWSEGEMRIMLVCNFFYLDMECVHVIAKDEIFGTLMVGLEWDSIQVHQLGELNRWKKLLKNSKSLKKDGQKNVPEGDSREAKFFSCIFFERFFLF